MAIINTGTPVEYSDNSGTQFTGFVISHTNSGGYDYYGVAYFDPSGSTPPVQFSTAVQGDGIVPGSCKILTPSTGA